MLKKILSLIMILVIMSGILVSYNKNVIRTSASVIEGEPVKVGVLLNNYDDYYVALIRKGLEEIQKENESKVQYSFFDGKGSQDIQNSQLDQLLQKKEFNLLLLNLVDQGNTKYVIDRIKELNIPVLFFGGTDIDSIKSYNKAYWIGTNPTEGGIKQGELIVDLWNSNKKNIDRDNDNIMQYIMLQGPSTNTYAIERTKHSILTINNAGIKTQELASQVCNWSEEEAKNVTKTLFLKLGTKIEVIIANNDSMAMGAIKALQEYGYNNGDKANTISVIGFDGIPEAQDLIKKGFMTGTVIQEPYDSSKALYAVGMNLVYNKPPTTGTEYQLDDTGVLIILHYKGMTINR